MDGVTLNGIHCSTWGLILSTVSIEKPTPKTSYIDIPFGDGSIDISEAAGEIKYQDRKITMSLQKFVESKAELETLSAEIAGKLQGKKVKINFDSDPDYYYYGRPIITSYQKTNPLAEIIIEAQCDPYKYLNDVTEQSFNCAYNLLMNGNMASADGWVPNYPITITAAENILTATSPSGYTAVQATHALTEGLVAGHKYYVKAESWTAILATHSLTLGSNTAISLSGAGASTWHLLSDVITAAASEAATIMAKIQYGTTNSHVNKLKNVLVIDLTKVYGAGCEPTATEFANILADFNDSWFDVAILGDNAVSDVRKTQYPPLLPVTLTNGRKTAYLVVTTNAPFSIVKGENIYTFGAVAALQSVIPLTEGENVLNLNGNGKITLDWQEGAL